MENITAHHLSVFPYSTSTSSTNGNQQQGGNPTTIYLGNPTPEQMQNLAKQSTHECGFVLSSPTAEDHANCDLAMRYWVPNHEMEMCGHATVGAIWLLHQQNKLPSHELRISTKSGVVEARVVQDEQLEQEQLGGNAQLSSSSTRVLVSQPKGRVDDITSPEVVHDILASLGLEQNDLTTGSKVQNACTSRTKTLIPIRDWETLSSITANPDSVKDICERIGSTGLYPYTIVDSENQIVQARQFPRSSGYLEDPATGIAAAALSFGLLGDGLGVGVGRIDARKPVFVRQGWTMGRPSEIEVRFRWEEEEVVGCWISGKVGVLEEGFHW